MTYLGGTFDDHLDSMTIPRLRVLQNVWKYDPPAGLVLARAHKVRERPKRMTMADQANALGEWGFAAQRVRKEDLEPIPLTLDEVKRMHGHG